MRQTVFALTSATLIFTCSLPAQTKLPPAPADYGQWETLVEGGGGGRGGGASTSGLSPDGKFLVYNINRSNGNNELRLTNIAAGTTKITAFGTQPAFSSDSHWLASLLDSPKHRPIACEEITCPSRKSWVWLIS